MPTTADPAANLPAEGSTVLDHVGLFLPDMGPAARAMARLGFALTPYTPQRHKLATGKLDQRHSSQASA